MRTAKADISKSVKERNHRAFFKTREEREGKFWPLVFAGKNE